MFCAKIGELWQLEQTVWENNDDQEIGLKSWVTLRRKPCLRIHLLIAIWDFLETWSFAQSEVIHNMQHIWPKIFSCIHHFFLLKFVQVLTFNCVDMEMVFMVIKNKTCRFMWNGSPVKNKIKSRNFPLTSMAIYIFIYIWKYMDNGVCIPVEDATSVGWLVAGKALSCKPR